MQNPPRMISSRITSSGTIIIEREDGKDIVVSATTGFPWHSWPDRVLVEDSTILAENMPDIADLVKALRGTKPQETSYFGE